MGDQSRYCIMSVFIDFCGLCQILGLFVPLRNGKYPWFLTNQKLFRGKMMGLSLTKIVSILALDQGPVEHTSTKTGSMKIITSKMMPLLILSKKNGERYKDLDEI